MKSMDMISSFNLIMRALTDFYGNTNSCNTNIWLHWLNNKTVLALFHINTRHQSVKMCTTNTDEIYSIAMNENISNLKIFFEMSIPTFKNVVVHVCNVNVGKCYVKNVLCRSNMILYLAFLLISSDCFTEIKFNTLMKDTKYDKVLVRHLVFEIIYNSINSPSAGTSQDSINNNPFSTKRY